MHIYATQFLLSLFLCCSVSFGFGQYTEYFKEDFSNGFNGGTTNGISNGSWTTNGNANSISDTDAVWEYRGPFTQPNVAIGSRGAYSGSTPITSPTASNGFMIFDSDYLDNGGIVNATATGIAISPHESWLISNSFSTVGSTGLTLNLSCYFGKYASSGHVLLSNDNGLTWGDTIAIFDETFNINYFSPTNTLISEPINYLTNTPNARIAIYFDGNTPIPFFFQLGYYHLMIDDIEIHQSPNHDLSVELTTINSSYDSNMTDYYTMIPFDVAIKDTLSFTSYIRNRGAMAQTNTIVSNTIGTPVGITTLNSTLITMPSGVYDSVPLNPSFVPSQGVGQYFWQIQIASDSTDEKPINNTTDTVIFEVTDTTFARDYAASGNFDIPNADYFEIGCKYHLHDSTTISSISIQIGNQTPVGKTIGVKLYNWNDLSTQIAFNFVTLSTAQIGPITAIPIPSVTVPPGDYFATIITYDTGVYITATNQEPQYHTVYFQPDHSGTWYYARFIPVVRLNIQQTISNCGSSVHTIVSNPISCSSVSDGSTTVSISSGASPFMYNWTNGSTADSSTNLSSGWHVVTITDNNGCITVDSIFIPEPDSLFSNPTVIDPISCFGLSNGKIQSNPTGGILPFVYNWTNGSNTSTSDSLGTGWQVVTITDANYCSTSDSILLIEPTLLTNAITLIHANICAGVNDGSASTLSSGGTLPYHYLWSNGDSTNLNGSLFSGWNFITITDSNNCSIMDSIHLVPAPGPIVNLGPDTTLCFNATYTLDAGNSFTSYLWQDGSSASSMNVITNIADTLLYSVSVSNSAGCTQMNSVEIITLKAIELAFTGDTNLCAYDNTELSVTSGYMSYLWNTSEMTENIFIDAQNLSSGIYTYAVSVTNTYGCQNSDSISLEIYEAVIVDLGPDTTLFDTGGQNIGYTLDAGPGFAHYLWSDNSIHQTFLVDLSNTGNISVLVTDQNGCEGSDTIIILIVNTITEIDKRIIKIYPNPMDDYLHLGFSNFPDNGDYQISIFSITGKLLYTTGFKYSGIKLTKVIDMTSFKSGQYILEINSDGFKKSLPLIVR